MLTILQNLPPEWIAAIAAGITGIIGVIIRWLEKKVLLAKLRGHATDAARLQAEVDALRKQAADRKS